MDALSANKKENLPASADDDRPPPAIESFIARWAKSGASERANYQLFLSELCTILGVPLPEPSTPEDHENAYGFERHVTIERSLGRSACPALNPKSEIQNPNFSHGFLDLYKRGCFVLETKQGVERKDKAALSEVGLHPATLARTFKGARKERVEALLETLLALGHARQVEGGRYSA